MKLKYIKKGKLYHFKFMGDKYSYDMILKAVKDNYSRFTIIKNNTSDWPHENIIIHPTHFQFLQPYQPIVKYLQKLRKKYKP